MNGIYIIKNDVNDKVYIGLSNNIQRRWRDHHYLTSVNDKSGIHQAMRKYGVNHFYIEVLEELPSDRQLMGEREKYWIDYYDSYHHGYNETIGGDLSQGRAKLTEKDVVDIRTRYKNLERCMIVYQDYKDKIGRSGFNKIWKGETWKNVMPEIYTLERIEYHKKHTGNSGSYNGRAKLTENDVRDIRTRKKNGESSSTVYEDYKDKQTKNSFMQVWCYQNWLHIKP